MLIYTQKRVPLNVIFIHNKESKTLIVSAGFGKFCLLAGLTINSCLRTQLKA